jgi:hypothetical protein
MQAERHIQFFDRGPELAILSKVVILDVVVTSDLREAVDEGSDESEFSNRAGKFLRSRLGVLQWDSRKSSESI